MTNVTVLCYNGPAMAPTNHLHPEPEPDREREREAAVEAVLISKKEVLERTGISYGQFYRWKRKGLIPESWFIRKSTFTGQETFLPREKILERIELIKRLKDQYSLEEIAELLSPAPPRRLFDGPTLRERLGIAEAVLERFRAATGREGPFQFREAFWMAAMDALRRQGAPPEAWELALRTLRRDDHDDGDGLPFEAGGAGEAEAGAEWTLWLLRKGQVLFVCLAPERSVRFDPAARVEARVELNRLLERTKMRLAGEPAPDEERVEKRGKA